MVCRPKDLLRDFSESPVTVMSRRGQRERLWSKVLSDTTNGCLADSGVNEKLLLHWLRVGFGPFAMASSAAPVKNPMVKTKTARISLTAHFLVVGKTPRSTKQWINGPNRRGQTAKAQFSASEHANP